MQNAISFDPWADITAAWFKLTPAEHEIVLEYSAALRDDCVEPMLLIEINRIHERHPDFCMASIPERLKCLPR
jgi:hypothetical protein